MLLRDLFVVGFAIIELATSCFSDSAAWFFLLLPNIRMTEALLTRVFIRE